MQQLVLIILFSMTVCCPGWIGTGPSIFRQPLHVSDLSRPIIRKYNRLYATIGIHYSF